MRDQKRDQQQVIQWARKLVQRGDFVILDTETVNFPPYCHPVEIGIISASGEVLFNELIKPPIPITPGAAGVHGITNERVADCQPYDVYHQQIAEIVSDRLICCYNVDFDRQVMHLAASHANRPTFPDRYWTCAMEAYAQWNGNWSTYHGSFTWVKLSQAAARLGVSLDKQTHRAVDDCLLTLGVIQALAKLEIETV